ncbi:ankyrin repeat domain-containing protein 39-like [Prorops nasuta]|uniref:ankyrin repeat domain-containing protein 39-like n=1 Tax=Prorops nasuta TaxID=863751 RepID=UPI0034CFF027
MDHSHGSFDSCCHSNNGRGANIRQTLCEMEFERGIWFAAQYNDLDRVNLLLRKGVSVDIEDSAGYTALHYSARNGHYEISELLLKNGASVDVRTRCVLATPLQRAASQGHVKIVQLLLRHGASANLQDVDGCTALHRAIQAKLPAVCEILIPLTDLTMLDNNGRSPKQLAELHCPEILPLVTK